MEKIARCEYEQFSLRNSPFKSQNKELILHKCESCSHVQAENVLTDDFYDFYSESEGESQYFGHSDFLDNKFIKLQKYLLNNKKMFEIGCGAGGMLKRAEKHFDYCLGIEPSRTTYNISKNKNLNVINSYFSKNLDIGTGYSAFASFRVFEHLCDLYAVLDRAYEILIPGGGGIINVPNGQIITEQSLYHQVVCQHVNYFTPPSLCIMAANSGFEVLEIESFDSMNELDLYIRKPAVRVGFDAALRRDKRKLQSIISSYKNISVWGAGAKARYYSSLLDDSNPIIHFLDSAANKEGLYVSGINIPVEKVTQSAISESDAVIIFASAYNREIIKTLREEYRFKGKIVYFDGQEIREED
ncbi:MAG: class I SAM-dependent methyltransferase [Oscillospiraceae bacterium]|jgi:SAM-dependent methyltransferase|nr:class I SAM-dependent methyltransferase [Oscillospiraceae bacterium]